MKGPKQDNNVGDFVSVYRRKDVEEKKIYKTLIVMVVLLVVTVITVIEGDETL